MSRLDDCFRDSWSPMPAPMYESLFSRDNVTVYDTDAWKLYHPETMDSVVIDTEDFKNEEEEGENLDLEKDEYIDNVTGVMTWTVTCRDPKDLSPTNILKTISAMKGSLAIASTPFVCTKVSCTMTASTKKHIIDSYRRVEMYGKNIPIVACCDDNLQIVSYTSRLKPLKGVTIYIIEDDSNKEQDLYLKLTGECSMNVSEIEPLQSSEDESDIR